MTKFQEAEEIVKKLNLSPHPEGGYFSEIYRNEEIIPQNHLPARYDGERKYITSIYFLLKGDNISHFHILKSDEIWYFHSGAPIIAHKISEDGKYEKEILGINFAAGEKPQVIFKRNTWFAAEVFDKESYTLIGCAVAPGFEFSDFKLGDRNELILKYPDHKEIIERLT
jgi:predicted cupin superfamily sugar epimerase